MTAEPAAAFEAQPVESSAEEFRGAVAEDLRQLAVLHDREPDAALIQALRGAGFPGNLALRLESGAGISARKKMGEGIALLPNPFDEEVQETLAVDFADIYLTYTLHVSPFESVWLDEDQLLNQQPMFEIRGWYERYGVAAQDWRIRSEDHLTLQLEFLALVLGGDTTGGEGETKARLADAARFMDEHLLRWIPEFALRVSERCATRYFAGVALITAAYLDELRDLLAEILETPRPSPEEIEERMKPCGGQASEEVMCDHTPVVAPGW